MKSRILLAGAALLLAVATVASAKSWNIKVDSAATAGTLQLPAGNYSVKLDGDHAVFTSDNSGKSYTVAVKLDKSARKFDDTSVENTMRGNTEVIESIELGGTTTKLEFGE
jgi:hypothetical protein